MRIACIMIFSIVVELLLLHTILRSCSAISTSLHHHHNHVTLINITADESTLLALKSSIISDPNHILTNNWSVAKGSCCNWVGVTCGTRHKRVVALSLSTMGLIGTIPPQIGNLSFLVSLDLSNNSFSGSLPKELSGLRRLKKINLRFNNFGGELPSWLGELTKLEHLVLSYNSFTGTIPPSFSNITKLVWLRLGINSLRGSIPPEIGSLANLEVLSIESNQLTGSIPLIIYTISTLKVIAFTNNSLSGNLPADICKRIPKIEGLYLSKNKLSGPILSSLHECSKLKVFALAGNEFSGIIPREIRNLTLLQTLSLGSNYLKGTIPQEIGNLYNLQDLDLSFNSFTGTIPQELDNLYNLQYVDLSFNSFTGTLDSIFNLSKLEFIEMIGNHLSGKLPSNIGHKQPNLRELNIEGNNFTGILPDSISNATKLENIMISGNIFSGTIPNSLGNLELLEILAFDENNFIIENSSSEISFITSLTNCRNLRVLVISYNSLNGYLPASIGNFSTAFEDFRAEEIGIRGILPSEIGNLSSLTTLYVGYNELTEKIPVAIRGLSSLQRLDLVENKIEGSIPDDLCLLQNLGSLRLEQNQISGPLPECIGNITSLRYLYLSSNALTSRLPTHLGNLKDLLVFNASRNSFSGHLPIELGNLNVAVLIDLSHNQFSGNIPSIFGGLQNLVNLSLANNMLQGPIPDTFKYSVSLENLDLSHNNFSGMIPKSLEALFHLRYFNVSFNSLRGEIPSEGPFKSFTSQSFTSNEALCGAPRFQVPLCHNSFVHHGSQRKKRVLLAICISLVTASICLTMTFAFVWIRRRRKSKVPSQIDLSQLVAPLRISYYELQRATDVFNESYLLGMGSFGSVYKGVLANGTFIAIKVFNLQFEGAFKSFDVECEVLRNLRHRNICKVISSCSNLDFKALVLEYMSNGSLEKWLYSHNHFLDILQRIDIMIDVACALDYLHYGYSITVVHCDLKPSNVLLDKDMVACLSDFGISKLLGEGESIAQTMTLATIGYIAPEYGFEGLVSRKCDVYSYGIMLMEIFTRTKPGDEQFLENMSLKRWVSDSYPNSIIQVINSNLLKPEDGDIAVKVQCISSIMEVALSCSADSPEERFNIKDVMGALKKIKLDFIANHRWVETSKYSLG